jgi:phosphoribosylanthranilate isomerase
MKLNFPFVQIAGVKDLHEAEMLSNFENLYIGFPLVLGYHKEDIPKKEVKKIIEKLNIFERSVLITYLNKSRDIIDLAKYINAKTVQIHSDIDLDELIKLRNESDLAIIKSIIIKDNSPNPDCLLSNEIINQISSQSYYVDAFITDTFDPKTGAIGATGLTHNWNISKQISEISEKPIILAGGLNPENVIQAISQVKPFGVDSHTGVEDENGFKSEEKVKIFYYESMKYLQLR